MGKAINRTGLFRPGRRLRDGLDVLDRWADTAGQTDKNALYEALFAVLDGSVCGAYPVFRDVNQPREFFVQVKDGLGVKVRILGLDTFGIVHIGPFSP